MCVHLLLLAFDHLLSASIFFILLLFSSHCSVPHHGSKNNSDGNFPTIFKAKKYLVSSDGSHYGHPSMFHGQGEIVGRGRENLKSIKQIEISVFCF